MMIPRAAVAFLGDAMTEPYVITHSDIKSFMECRQAWRWSGWRPPERKSGPLALGNRVHAGLARYEQGYTDALDYYEQLWRLDWPEVEGTFDEDQFLSDVIVGRNCLNGYFDWLAETGADNEYESYSVEETYEADFLNGKVRLRIRPDVIWRQKESGFLVVNDWKTSARVDRDVAGLMKSWQHDVYSIVLSLALSEEIIAESYYTLLKKVKKPTSDMVTRVRVPESFSIPAHRVTQLERVCTEMLSLIARGEQGDFDWAYPMPSDKCAWCDYRKPCDIARGRPEGAQQMLDAEFIKIGRLARYDSLT